jgi:hypothetical protein
MELRLEVEQHVVVANIGLTSELVRDVNSLVIDSVVLVVAVSHSDDALANEDHLFNLVAFSINNFLGGRIPIILLLVAAFHKPRLKSVSKLLKQVSGCVDLRPKELPEIAKNIVKHVPNDQGFPKRFGERINEILGALQNC